MKRMKHSRKGRSRSDGTAEPPPAVDIDAQIETIKRIEEEQKPDLGSRIHQFSYGDLELRLDRDITGSYRLCVFEGTERRFSFTVRCEQGDYESLRTSFQEIIAFLNGDRRIADLPRHDRLTGHYFGA